MKWELIRAQREKRDGQHRGGQGSAENSLPLFGSRIEGGGGALPERIFFITDSVLQGVIYPSPRLLSVSLRHTNRLFPLCLEISSDGRKSNLSAQQRGLGGRTVMEDTGRLRLTKRGSARERGGGGQ